MNIHFSSKTAEWETPQAFFDEINKEFNLNVDVCASMDNHKLSMYFSKMIDDGLSMDWDNYRCWMNPPYGREIGKWVKKASEAKGGIVVCLLPARTDTKWFHEYIYNKAEIRFLKGRLKFLGITDKKENIGKYSAPFPSMVVIFRVQKADCIYKNEDCKVCPKERLTPPEDNIKQVT